MGHILRANDRPLNWTGQESQSADGGGGRDPAEDDGQVSDKGGGKGGE